MSSTDFLELNRMSMFANIRNSLLMETKYSQDLLECKNDLLYAWDSKEFCLLVLNWRIARTRGGHENINYQMLVPSSRLTFDVERVKSSTQGSLMALAGLRGLCILELPQHCGANGQFMQGKHQITCRTTNLDARLFNENPHLQLKQIRWHPASPTDSHLLVLWSDNTIRVYDNGNIRHVWQVGPLLLRNDTNLNASAGYGLDEIVVDFDIGPAVTLKTDEVSLNMTTSSNSINSRRKPKQIQWPLVILRENGNIYVLMAALNTEKPSLQGPLKMTPSQTDNYGSDSCSLLIIPSLPPTLVIAETNGKLHHALLLEAKVAEFPFGVEVEEGLITCPCEWTINVLETIDLQLGLLEDISTKRYDCSIFLKRDFINESRYFAYHNTGLHVIIINFLTEMNRFLENEVYSDMSSVFIPSHAEYLVSTKIDSGEHVNAVLGFVFTQMPHSVVLLLSSGQVLSLKLIIDSKLLTPIPTMKTIPVTNAAIAQEHSQLNELITTSFVDDIRGILKRDTVNQPILSLNKFSSSSPPTLQESYELLCQAIESLRTQYMKKHELVRVEFNKRILILKLVKERQDQDIRDLEEERNKITNKSRILSDKFEKLREEQSVLTNKYENLIRVANTRLSGLNNLTQKKFITEIKRLHDITRILSSSFQKYKNIFNNKNNQIAKYQENSTKTNELSEAEEHVIKANLWQINIDIESQMKEIKRIMKIMTQNI
uniref:Nuclear pore complex protein Nup88 n=1 Tax=Glossina brevipalpis TaxID=37001 RepID=A0A1A9W7V8_9MUSC